MPVWFAPMQVMSNMVYALERQLHPKVPLPGFRVATGQHMQSSSFQSACHHMAHSLQHLPMPRPSQQAKQNAVKHIAQKAPRSAWEMLLCPQTEAGAQLPEKGYQQQHLQSKLQQSRLHQVQPAGRGDLQQRLRVQADQALAWAPEQLQQQSKHHHQQR